MSQLAALTEREVHVLRRLLQGNTDDQVARELGIAPSTVQSHVANIHQKLGASNRMQCGFLAARLGVDIDVS